VFWLVVEIGGGGSGSLFWGRWFSIGSVSDSIIPEISQIRSGVYVRSRRNRFYGRCFFGSVGYVST
jgi:hypothetical protein